jgi:hypothetical protein
MSEDLCIISPHIDDAVLSIGGFLCHLNRHKIDINISYIFSISNWTNPNSIVPCTVERDVELVTCERKNEEKTASEALGYRYDFAEFLDWPIRDQSNRSFSKLKMDLYHYFTEKFNFYDTLFFPIGISHPDHYIIGEIARILSEENFKIIYYEDLPYFARYGATDRSRIYEKLIKWNLKPMTIPINIQDKLEAVNIYKSQVSQQWINEIENYSYSLTNNNHLERLWIPESIEFEIVTWLKENYNNKKTTEDLLAP